MNTKKIISTICTFALAASILIPAAPAKAAGSYFVWTGGGDTYRNPSRTYIDRPVILGKGDSVAADYHDTEATTSDGKVKEYGYYLGFNGVSSSIATSTERTVTVPTDAKGTTVTKTGVTDFTITGDDIVLFKANSAGDTSVQVQVNLAGEEDKGIDTIYTFNKFGVSMESLGGTSFPVTYDLNGGEWASDAPYHPETIPVLANDKVYTLGIPVKKGYIFNSWNNAAGDAVRGEGGTSNIKAWGYEDTTSVESWFNQAKSEMTNGITLIAMWDEDPNYDPSQEPKDPDEKSSQKITAKVTSKTIKASALKKSAKSFSIGASAKTALSYKITKTPAGATNKISVSKKGKVTLKKGAKKGTYKIKITAKATDTYKSATKTVTVKVK